MTDQTRRLTPEMRLRYKREKPGLIGPLQDALHDLDVAEEELAAVAQLRAELAAAQATIAQRDAVIAAMREALRMARGHIVEHHNVSRTPKWGEYCPVCHHADGTESEMDKLSSIILDTAQLAETHDAVVRADERRKVLEEAATVALGHQISETSLCAEWGRQCATAIRRLHRPVEQLAAQPEEGR